MDFLVIRLYPRGILVIQNISSFFLFKKFSIRFWTNISHKNFQLQGSIRSNSCLHIWGVPIFNGKMKAVYFEYIIEKIRKRLAGCRITLIKSVLCSIPIYTACYGASTRLWLTSCGTRKVKDAHIGLVGIPCADLLMKEDLELPSLIQSGILSMQNYYGRF